MRVRVFEFKNVRITRLKLSEKIQNYFWSIIEKKFEKKYNVILIDKSNLYELIIFRIPLKIIFHYI